MAIEFRFCKRAPPPTFGSISCIGSKFTQMSALPCVSRVIDNGAHSGKFLCVSEERMFAYNMSPVNFLRCFIFGAGSVSFTRMHRFQVVQRYFDSSLE